MLGEIKTDQFFDEETKLANSLDVENLQKIRLEMAVYLQILLQIHSLLFTCHK